MTDLFNCIPNIRIKLSSNHHSNDTYFTIIALFKSDNHQIIFK